MPDTDTIVKAYVAAWAASDEAERRRHIETAWSEDGRYRDPTADVVGRESLSRHIAGFHQRFPGASIVLTSGVAHHHGRLYFTWKMIGADGTTLLEGCDFGELDDDGRLSGITGFFGHPPPL